MAGTTLRFTMQRTRGITETCFWLLLSLWECHSHKRQSMHMKPCLLRVSKMLEYICSEHETTTITTTTIMRDIAYRKKARAQDLHLSTLCILCSVFRWLRNGP